MDNKWDSISSCKIMISFYNIFQRRQIQEQTFCQERIKWIPKKTTKISKCPKPNYGKKNKHKSENNIVEIR